MGQGMKILTGWNANATSEKGDVHRQDQFSEGKGRSKFGMNMKRWLFFKFATFSIDLMPQFSVCPITR